jgi:thiol-disulfide isomerase/thioredoxin
MKQSTLVQQLLRQSAHSSPLRLRGSSFLLQPAHFSATASSSIHNRVFSPVLTPPTFHDYLRLVSANNMLLLALFTTSGCAPCRIITPLLTDLVNHRSPTPDDKFDALALAEVELDSADRSNGPMTDLGVEWGVTSMPTLIGFGGRRADRITERLADTKLMCDKPRITQWVDEAMQKGDPYSTGSGSGKGGLLSRLFG